jgi:hypothetical protein
MQPHPILMHTLHDERNREVEAILTRQHVDQVYDALALAVSGACHPLVVRILSLLALMRRLPGGEATGAAAALRN